MLLNYGAGEDSWESLGQQGDPTSPPKGDQSWVFIGRTDAETETPILWPPHGKSWLIWKDPDAGRDSGQEEKGMTEDEMVGWHHRLNGHGFRWTPGVGDGQGGLGSQRVTTERLNWTELCTCPLTMLYQTVITQKEGGFRRRHTETGHTKDNLLDHCTPGALLCCADSFWLVRLRPTLCNPMDCSLPGSSALVILQARILEWVAICMLNYVTF